MFDFLLDLVGGSSWAYLGIAGLVAVDAFFPVVPGETSIVTGAILAANGELSLALVFVAGAVGAVVGDNISYALGATLGERAGRRLFTSARARSRRAWAERQLRERGVVIVVVSRFVPGGRTAVTFSAGALAYPWRRFIAADLVAATAWSAFAVALGWFGGNTYTDSLWRPLLLALAVGAVLALGGELFARLTGRRAGRAARG